MKRNKKLLSCILALGFLLGLYRGQLALWKDQDPEPIRVFPYGAEMLPKSLQQALQAGIPIDSLADLEELLEKYLP